MIVSFISVTLSLSKYSNDKLNENFLFLLFFYYFLFPFVTFSLSL